jgi:uncharacterized protein YbjQ (UPF0145 family)
MVWIKCKHGNFGECEECDQEEYYEAWWYLNEHPSFNFKIPFLTGDNFEFNYFNDSLVIDVVKGSTVRTKNFGRDILATLKGLLGGEVRTYTNMTAKARDEAYDRMISKAVKLEADAIINVRFSTSMVMAGASEMLAYGTAVKLNS